MGKPISKIYWFWIPVIFMAAQLVIERILPGQILGRLHSEGGPHETLQFLVLAIAFILAVRTVFLPQLNNQGWLRAWIALAAACCLYVAGEEISWGQHVIQWSTPGYWAALNDQNETNLHNTSAWFDQKPRIVLELGILVGGIIIPLLQRYKPSLVPKRFASIYGPQELYFPAMMILLIRFLDFSDNGKAFNVFRRGSEVEELYLFYFVMLYVMALRRRILQQ